MLDPTDSKVSSHVLVLPRPSPRGCDPQLRPLRAGLVLAAVLLPFLALSVPGHAQESRSRAPTLTPIAQSRWTDASASSIHSNSRYAEAPDLEPFVSELSAGSEGAAGQATQSSQILPDAIVAKGNALAAGIIFNKGSGSSSGWSWVEVRFSVETRMTYRARGALNALGGGSHFELQDGNGVPLLVHEASGSIDHVAIDERGLLAPGEYVVLVDAGAAGSGQFWLTQASFELTLEVQPVGRAHDWINPEASQYQARPSTRGAGRPHTPGRSLGFPVGSGEAARDQGQTPPGTDPLFRAQGPRPDPPRRLPSALDGTIA